MQTQILSHARCVLVNPFLEPTDLRDEVQSFDGESTHESALNYGLLVAASSLVKRGVSVQIVDLERRRKDWAAALDEAVAATDPQWIGIGTLSVYSFLPTVAILRRCREQYRGALTVVGGQNAQNVPMLLDHIGERELLDYVVCGDGERAACEIAAAAAEGRQPSGPGISALGSIYGATPTFAPRMPLDEESSFLCYDLYPDYRHLWPVVEESRGCPFRCSFCANSLQGGARITYKNPELLLAETRRLFQMYGARDEMPVVLMTSIFGVNPSITREFFQLLSSRELTPRFVASTRVDLRYESYIDLMPRFFDQMHFGLESGAQGVVSHMQKTPKPERYLQLAEKTLRAWHDRGVHTALNLILGYMGETRDTVNETLRFLEKHRDCIDSVWGGGLIAYPDSPFARNGQVSGLPYGARLERVSEYCDVLRTYPVSPSSSFDYDDVLASVDRIHRLFYDNNRYYHHYKWYVGPRRDRSIPEFVTHAEFERRFEMKRLVTGSASFLGDLCSARKEN